MHPGPPGPHRRHRGPDVRAHTRGRLLPGHAAVPLQRPDGRLGPGADGGLGLRAAPTGRFSASGFLPDVRAAGATYFNYVGKPLSYILATPERPDDADNPLVRGFGNEGRPRTSPVSPSASASRSPTPTARPRAAPPCSARPTRHRVRSAGPPRAPSCSTPPPARSAPRPLRRAGAAAQRRGGHRRAGVQDRRRRLRGLLAQRRGRDGPAARRLVLDRRPRLPRRGRLLLLRRARPRLAARRRRELRRRPSRASCSATPTSCWPRSTPCPTPSSATR